jgi:hypothetical protein
MLVRLRIVAAELLITIVYYCLLLLFIASSCMF